MPTSTPPFIPCHLPHHNLFNILLHLRSPQHLLNVLLCLHLPQHLLNFLHLPPGLSLQLLSLPMSSPTIAPWPKNMKGGPSLGPSQASTNTIGKILDTINNLVQILKLTITVTLSPAPLPTKATPATVILPKATMLRSGLDLVSPQSASDLHSKVLTDCIAAIIQWATSVPCTPTIPPPPSLSLSGDHLPPTPSLLPPKVTPLPPLAQAYQQALQRTFPSLLAPKLAPTTPLTPRAQPKATPPKARPCKPPGKPAPKPPTPTHALPSASPAFFSAGPATLGITHPISPIGPAALSAAPASLGITYPSPTRPPSR